MSNLDHLTPHELVARVENRNRRFKLASIVFGAILITGLAILLIIGLSTLQGVKNQLTQQKQLLDSQQQILTQIQKSSEQRTHQINDLQQHIDCIVALLQQPNRSSLTITDLESCKISSNGAVGSNDQSNPTSASAPAQSAPAKTSTLSTGASNKKSTPTSSESTLDHIPALGRVFKKLGL